ncbi:Protein required for attachment to host cells [Jannaschia seosinensis]|uniref:Protein required for attachment to host cells n=1 Tax=Jannaschia seosinensis TaxID=313367 RepID=A0A0M7BA38_9RHOB|nr:host attachment family protein [Jannaschia seosinensis]CUH39049.1 Protein required for attachment to host cells [Jannaschia seosinensis]
MVKLKNKTLVVVTDSEKALFLVNRTDGDDPNLEVIRKDEEANPPDREQSANVPGTTQESAAPGVRSYQETDFHELQKERFAKDLSDKLYKMAHSGDFDSLVIVAPPSVLGTLRDEMHQEVSDKVIGEIDKTLTGHPVPDIEKIVVETLAEMDDHRVA